MSPLQIFTPHRLFTLAGTYVLASKLPSSILDALIHLPHFLVSVRNGLSPAIPARTIPTDQLPPPVSQKQKAVAKTHQGHEGHIPNCTGDAEIEPTTVATTETQDEESSSGDEKQSNPSSNGDADVESNAGDASVVDSWVNLREKHD